MCAAFGYFYCNRGHEHQTHHKLDLGMREFREGNIFPDSESFVAGDNEFTVLINGRSNKIEAIVCHKEP